MNKANRKGRKKFRKEDRDRDIYSYFNVWHKCAPKSEIIDFEIVYEDILGSIVNYSSKEIKQIKEDALKILKNKYGILFRGRL